MPFQLAADETLLIEGVFYSIAQDRAVEKSPVTRAGTQSTIYQLVAEQLSTDVRKALKIFKPRYRLQALAYQSHGLAGFASLPGLRVCRRTVLTPRDHGELLRRHVDLTYAVLMPWIDGPSWAEALAEKKALTQEESLQLAVALAGILANMEQKGIAHCELSSSNLLIPGLAAAQKETSQSPVELVDAEQLYATTLERPESSPGGSPGYSHRSSVMGQWGAGADRFSGAILLAEILGWCNDFVRTSASGDSYFDPGEIQRDSERYHTLEGGLREQWNDRLPQLFGRAWSSTTLDQCPTFAEWLELLSLISAASTKASAGLNQPDAGSPSLVPPPAQIPSMSQPDNSSLSVQTPIEPVYVIGVEERKGEVADEFEFQGDVALSTLLAGESGQGLAPIDQRDDSRQADSAASSTPYTSIPISTSLSGPSEATSRPDPPRSIRVLDTTSEIDLENSPQYLAYLFDRAVAAHKNGELAKARELLDQVLRRSPDYARDGERADQLLYQLSEQNPAQLLARRRRSPLVTLLVIVVLLGAATSVWYFGQMELSSSTPVPTAVPIGMPTGLPTSTPGPDATAIPNLTGVTPPPAMFDAIVNTSSLNLREGPGEEYPTVVPSPYPKGAGLNVIGKEPDAKWLKVQTLDNNVGWMSAKYLYLNIDVSKIPIVAIPPTPVPPPPTYTPSVELLNKPIGRIAFASNRGNMEESDIYIMNADGSNQHRITNGGGNNLFPDWSPDNRWIAYITGSNPGCATDVPAGDIYILAADGATTMQLTSGRCARGPRWSPDGSMIAFSDANGKDASLYDIYVARSDGSGIQQLTSAPGFDAYPSWMPDGRILFVSERTGESQLYAMNSDGSDQRAITVAPGEKRQPAASPDGTRFAFAFQYRGSWDIWVMAANGAWTKKITDGQGRNLYPTWSPDSRWLAFHSNRDDTNNYEVYMVPADGGEIQRVTMASDYDDEPAWSR